MPSRPTIHLSPVWLLVGAGALVALGLITLQPNFSSDIKTAASSKGKACTIDYKKPIVKQTVSCIVKSASNKVDAYIVSTTLKVTPKGVGSAQMWEAQATCRLLCDCNNVSATPEYDANSCNGALGDKFRNLDSAPTCKVPASYKVPFGYATTVKFQDKDKSEAIRRINDRCEGYEKVKTNICSSQCISQMPANIKNTQAEVSCGQCLVSPTPTPKATPIPTPKTPPAKANSNILKRMADFCRARGWVFENKGTTVRCGELFYSDYVRLESRWRMANPDFPK
jgi:hypothetical protein